MKDTITLAGPEASGDSGFQKLTDSDGNGIKATLPDFESGDTQPGGTYIVPMRCKLISREGKEASAAEGEPTDEADRNEPGEGREIEVEFLGMGTPIPVKDQRPMSFPRDEGGGEEDMMSNLRAATGGAPPDETEVYD